MLRFEVPGHLAFKTCSCTSRRIIGAAAGLAPKFCDAYKATSTLLYGTLSF